MPVHDSNLERKRDCDLSATNRDLFNQLRLGFVDPCPNFDPPMDAATRVMQYSAMVVERMWTMVGEGHARVGPVMVPPLV